MAGQIEGGIHYRRAASASPLRPSPAPPDPAVLRRHAAELEAEGTRLRRRAREVDQALAAIRACLATLSPDPAHEVEPPTEHAHTAPSSAPSGSLAPVAVARPPVPAAPPGPPVRVWMLGGFQVAVGDRTLDARGSSKIWSVLKFLLSRAGGPVSADLLAETFWRRSPARSALQSVYSAAHAARRLLGAAGDLVCEGGCYSLMPGSEISSDVAYFRERIRRARQARRQGNTAEDRARLEEALDAYRGPFLPEEAYARWAADEREALEADRLSSLERLGVVAEEHEDFEAALAYRLSVLREDPLREDSHRAVIRIQLRTGQRPLALQHYREVETLLRRELGIRPDERTRALVEDLSGS